MALDQIPADHVSGSVEAVRAVDSDQPKRIALEEVVDGVLEVSDVPRVRDHVTLGEDLAVGDPATTEEPFVDGRPVVLGREGQIDDESDVDLLVLERVEHVVRGEQSPVGLRHRHFRPKRHFEGF